MLDGTGDGVFACECPNECGVSIELPMSEYRSVRGHPTRFIVVEGHEDETIERVIVARDVYLVVEKPMAPQTVR